LKINFHKEFAAKEKLGIILSAPVPAFNQESRSGRQGELGGGIPPALQILGEICSNFFERTPLKE